MAILSANATSAALDSVAPMAQKPRRGPERQTKPSIRVRGTRGTRGPRGAQGERGAPGPRGAQGERGHAGPAGLIDHRLDGLPAEVAAAVKELRVQFERFAQVQKQMDDLARALKTLEDEQHRSAAQISEILSLVQKSH